MSPPDENKLMFPITDSAVKFNEAAQRIRSLSAPVRKAIEDVQPFNRPHPKLPPLLAILRDFENIDKHRLLRLAYASIIDDCLIGGVSVKIIPLCFNHACACFIGPRLANRFLKSDPVSNGHKLDQSSILFRDTVLVNRRCCSPCPSQLEAIFLFLSLELQELFEAIKRKVGGI